MGHRAIAIWLANARHPAPNSGKPYRDLAASSATRRPARSVKTADDDFDDDYRAAVMQLVHCDRGLKADFCPRLYLQHVSGY